MAQAFPQSRFHGFDVHAASIDEARRNAADGGVAARVALDAASAVNYPSKNYGLICFFDSLHDMSDPIAAARHAAKALDPNGTVLLVEPFANDRLQDNRSPVARLYYAASTTICCAHAISLSHLRRELEFGHGSAAVGGMRSLAPGFGRGFGPGDCRVS